MEGEDVKRRSFPAGEDGERGGCFNNASEDGMGRGCFDADENEAKRRVLKK